MEARSYAEEWLFPDGTFINRLQFAPGIDEETQLFLYDLETSIGLLIAMAEDKLKPLYTPLAGYLQPHWPIGEVVAEEGIVVER